MNSKATTCPPTDTLNDFVEGKLEPPTLDECELHISECPACLETLRGLGTEGTLTGHVAAAMNESDTSGSSVQLDNLLARMLTQPHDFKSPKQSPSSHLPAELMADRAAEVLRCLEPADDQSLGALGDYDLERLIGTGSSGVVFQATDRTLNRTVALKVLRPSLGEMARQRFISEARSAAAIEHPHVVTIYQVGQADRLAFMAMQWIPGQSLEQLLAAGSIFVEDEIRQIARQIAAGLQAAHQRQIIHRDIKPANIWITQQDRSVKILDFGLARIADDDPGLTATGMLAGTPNFMSPEQTKGLELDGRSDLFSLGCLMYRLITGRLPFGASTVLATLQAIQNYQPPSVQSLQPTCSDDLTDVTMALLEKQSANRPESAAQLVEILDTDRPSWPVQINRYSVDPQTDNSLAKPQASSSQSNGNFARWIIATIGLGLFALGGFLFAPQIIRIATDQGEIVIETNDPDVEVEILKDGKTFRVVDTKTDQSFDIRSGSYEIRAKASPANSEADQEVAFDVTPERLIMKRGQQQIVKVTKAAEAPVHSSSGDALLGIGSLSNDPKIQANELIVERPILRTYPITIDPKLAFDLLGTMLEGRDARMQQDEGSGAITVFGRKEDHEVVVKSLASVGNVDDNWPINSQRTLVSEGQDFGHWMKVAKTDRSAKSAANSIRACGALAETDAQRKELFEIIGNAARRYGTCCGQFGSLVSNKTLRQVLKATTPNIDLSRMAKLNDDEYVMGAVLQVMWDQPPELTVSFVEEQLRNGNSRSVQFCNLLLQGGFGTSTSKFQQPLASRLNVLLPLAIVKREPLIYGVVSSSWAVSREELLKLNPNLDSLVTKLFWGQTEREDIPLEVSQSFGNNQLQNSKLIGELGKLASYLRVDDDKIVEYLADHYSDQIGVTNEIDKNGISDPYFQALTVDLSKNWYPETSYPPLVGWHDELRFGIFLKILQMELSDEAVQRRGGGPNVGLSWKTVYQFQECLYVLLPKMDSKVRQQAREKFVTIKSELPNACKSFNGSNTNVEHNLEALIAICDGKTQPVVIKSAGANGVTNFPGMSNMLGIVEQEQRQITAKREGDSPSSSGSELVYDGQNFEQWLNVAKTDRLPKTVANAIRACGALAETDTERKELFEIIGGAAQRHGSIVISDSQDDFYVMSTMLNAIWNQPPKLAVDFVEKQLRSGNSRSLDFCTWILNGGFNKSIAPDIGSFNQAFASHLNELLPLAIASKKEQLVGGLVSLAASVSRKKLLKLNPNSDSLVAKLFWEQTKLEDSQLVAPLGQLAAHLRVDDVKIVEYLANQYMKRIWETNGINEGYFQALVAETNNSKHWYLATDFQPIVGWHDEVRFKILSKFLQTELSDKAVQRRRIVASHERVLIFQKVYRLQECLYALLPKVDDKVRQQAKEKFAAVKRDLPKLFKSLNSGALDFEHNLNALIAVCDGGDEPALIKIPQAKGSRR